MKSEIKEIIKSHLPEQVGKVLQERLAQADDLESKLEKAITANTEAVELIKSLQLKNKELEALKIEKENLDMAKIEISAIVSNQKVFEAELKATEAEKRANELAGIVQMVFKSPVYRKSYVNDLFYGAQGTTGGIHNSSTTTED